MVGSHIRLSIHSTTAKCYRINSDTCYAGGRYLTKIITDTTAGLPVEMAHKYNITIIPQIVTFGENSYYEGVELDNAAFMAKLKAAPQLPKTSAPPPELFSKEFQRLQSTGEPVLCLHPSSEVSGTVRSASVAARDFPRHGYSHHRHPGDRQPVSHAGHARGAVGTGGQ